MNSAILVTNASSPQPTHSAKTAVAPAKAGAYDVCLGRTTGAIGPSLRWGDGNFGDGCVDPEIDIYRLFANLLRTHVFSSQLIGVFRIMLRSKAMVDAKQGCFGEG